LTRNAPFSVAAAPGSIANIAGFLKDAEEAERHEAERKRGTGV